MIFLRTIALLALSAAAFAQSYTINTLAGGAPLVTPTTALNASVGQPTSVAVDADGNVYFTSHNSVFKVDGKGVLTTVAGSGRPDFQGDGGPAVKAALNQPNGLAIDSKGNVYVSDYGNHRIRWITPDGNIKTYAGNGNVGSGGDGGALSSATFTFPRGLALDSAGNLYIADFGANVVREITAAGKISTIAGTGTAGFSGDAAAATAATLSRPSGVAVDSAGNIYISDTGNQVVRKITTDGNINTFAGSNSLGAGFAGDTGAATSAQLNLPEALVIDKAGSVYISDYANALIRIVIPDGTIGTYAGTGSSPGFSGDGGAASSAQLNGVLGMAIDTAGNFFIADYYNLRIRKISPSKVITTVPRGRVVSFGGDGGQATQAVLGTPYGIAVDASGNVYFSDFENFRVRKIAANGVISTFAGNGTLGYSGDGGQATKAQLTPTGLALDSTGNLYIADFLNNVVRMVTPGGVISTVAGNRAMGAGFSGDTGAATAAQLNYPTAVVLDNVGNLYIADWGNFVIRKVTPFGVINTVAGVAGTRGFTGDNGAGTTANLSWVNGLAVDAAGNLYISDWGNYRIRRLSTGQLITTVAGNGAQGFSGDNLAATATAVANPYGIVVDASGTIYFADSFNSRIRRVDAGTGLISTIAGNGTNGYTGDGGPSILGELFYPLGLARDSKGTFYISDSQNQVIRTLRTASTGGNAVDFTNAASNEIGALAAGEIVTLYGAGIGASTLTLATPADGLFPNRVAETQVLINGVAAPMIYSSPNQVAAIVPYDVAGASHATVQVLHGASSTTPFNLPVRVTSPGLFTADQSGSGQAAALNQDTSPNGKNNPARHGSVLVLYATGEGQTTPGGVNGRVVANGVANSSPAALPHPAATVAVTIGGIAAQVQYAGAVPGQVAGLMQVNVVIPSGVTAGNAVPVVLTVGGTSSQSGITVAISEN